jgi:hypothetical protein
MKKQVSRPHDHRGSVWLLANGSIIWCYVCGAWRPNFTGRRMWYKPSGDKAINPAVKGAI